MVVGKSIPNLLIAEGLLKILGDLVPSFPPKSLTNSLPQNGRTTKIPVSIFSDTFSWWNEQRLVMLTVNIWQVIFFSISNGVNQVNIKPLTIKPTQNLRCYVNIAPLTTNLSYSWKINVCHVKATPLTIHAVFHQNPLLIPSHRVVYPQAQSLLC